MVFGALRSAGDIVSGREIAILLRGVDELTDPMGKAERALNKFDKTSKNTSKQIKTTNTDMTTLSKTSMASKIAFGLGAAAVVGFGAKLIEVVAQTDRMKLAMEKLSKETSKLTDPIIEQLSIKMSNYILLLTMFEEKITGANAGSDEFKQRLQGTSEMIDMLANPFAAFIDGLISYTTTAKRAGLESELSLKKGIDEAKKSFEEAKIKVEELRSSIQGLINLKTPEEIGTSKEKIKLQRQINLQEKSIRSQIDKGVISEEEGNKLLEDNTKQMNDRIKYLDLELEDRKLQREDQQLSLDLTESENSELNEIIAKNGSIPKAIQAQIIALKAAYELEKSRKKTVDGLIDSYDKLAKRETKSSSTSSSKSSGKVTIPAGSGAQFVDPRAKFDEHGNVVIPKNDFVMRPGQSAVSFSPDDTIIGVKEPSKLKGSSPIINITIQGSVIRERDLMLELSKAMQKELMTYIRY